MPARRGARVIRVLFAFVLAGCGAEPEPSAPPPAVVVAADPAEADAGSTSPAAGSSDVPDTAEAEAEAEAAIEPAPDPDAPDAEGWIRGEVEAGDSLARILGRRDVSPQDVAAIASALTPVMDPATIRPGQGWALRVDATGAWTELHLLPTALRTIHVDRDEAGTVRAEAVDVETEVRVVDVVTTVESSLWAAVTGAGEDPALVAELVELLASQIDFFTDTREGDRIAIVLEKHFVGDEFVRYGRVLGATYDGGVGKVQGLWWTAPGNSEGTYYTPDGGSLDRTLLKSPLKFTRVSSGFDAKRMHPVLHRVKGHWGIDYAAPTGTPVWAAADGKIVRRAPAGSAGNLVVLEHDGGFQTYYMHLDGFAKGQAVGDRVRQKTVIGTVGTTGRSTGPHLHFGVKRAGRWVDPASVRSIERPGVPKRHRDRFRADTREVRARVDALLAGEP